MNKNVHGKLKICRIFITLVIAGCLLQNGLMAEACICGNLCLHGLQFSEKSGKSGLMHFRCSKDSCKTCNLEDGQSYKAYSGHRMGSGNGNVPHFSVSPLTYRYDYICNPMKVDFVSLPLFFKFSPPPAYIKNLSFLL